MNSTAINFCLQVTFQVSAFSSFVCLPRSGIVDHSMTNLLRTCHSIFHCGYPALYPHQQYTWVPDSSCPCKHLFSDFGVIALLMGMKWYHIMVLICVSLMIMTVSIFYNAYWEFLYHFWRNVYSSLLHVFELDFVIVVGVDLLNSIYSKRFWRLKSSKEAWPNTQCECTGTCWEAWGFLVASYSLIIDYVIYTFLHQSDCVYQHFLLVLACLSIRIFLSNLVS